MIIGTCSLCQGPVAIPTAWYSTNPPVPTCLDCRATAKTKYGAIIEMQTETAAPAPVPEVQPEFSKRKEKVK